MSQEKQNKRLAFILVVLLCGLTTVLLLKSAPANEIDAEMYHAADLAKTDHISMESPKGKITLQFDGNRWTVNNEFEADRNLVEVLFATLKQVEPKRPVASSTEDSLITALEKSGVKVSLSAGNENQQVFYAGGNQTKTEAYFLDQRVGKPHVVVIPGYRIYVSGIFELAAANWREKLVFDFNWRNFKNLKAHFRNEKGDFEVNVEKNVAVMKEVSADTARLNTFLDQLSLFTVQEFLEPQSVPDSLSKVQPLATFTIEDIAKRSYELKVYHLGKQFYGVLKGGYVAILDNRKILPLLRPKEFFVKR